MKGLTRDELKCKYRAVISIFFIDHFPKHIDVTINYLIHGIIRYNEYYLSEFSEIF